MKRPRDVEALTSQQTGRFADEMQQRGVSRARFQDRVLQSPKTLDAMAQWILDTPTPAKRKRFPFKSLALAIAAATLLLIALPMYAHEDTPMTVGSLKPGDSGYVSYAAICWNGHSALDTTGGWVRPDAIINQRQDPYGLYRIERRDNQYIVYYSLGGEQAFPGDPVPCTEAIPPYTEPITIQEVQ